LVVQILFFFILLCFTNDMILLYVTTSYTFNRDNMSYVIFRENVQEVAPKRKIEIIADANQAAKSPAMQRR